MFRRCFHIILLGLGLLWMAPEAEAQFVRYGVLSINTHGSPVPPALLGFIKREGELLVAKNRALGINVPANFYFKIDFLPSFEAYRRFAKVAHQNDVGPETLGFTVSTVATQKNGNQRKPAQFPVDIVCYWKADEPWEIVPTLLHEMNHAVHAADFGMMPTWLQEGMSEWFANRKYVLGVDKKIARMNQYQRYMKVVEGMKVDTFINFITATSYGEWERLVGDVGMCYFLSETLVDFFIGNPTAQPYFRAALQKAKAGSDWQFERTLILARDIEKNWPRGISFLLTGWKNWYKKQAKPKVTNTLEPFLDANAKRFHEMVRDVRAKSTVTDADRYALVSQWLAFQRLANDDLTQKLGESYHRSENILIRSRQFALQQFARQDHDQRNPATLSMRKHLRETRPSTTDPLYKRALPYASISWYLNLDPASGAHPRPAYLGSTRLPPPAFKWQGLDTWQANMIFTNLFRLHLSQPAKLPTPKLKADSTGPFASALRQNKMNAEAALKAVGGKLTRDPLSGRVLKLDLSSTAVDNDDLRHLALLFDPRELDLSDTDITDSCSNYIAGWASLRRVNLRRTRLSAGTVDHVRYFSPGLIIE